MSILRSIPETSNMQHGPNTLLRAVDTDFGVSGIQPQSWFDKLPGLGYTGFITALTTFFSGVFSVYTDAPTALTRALNSGLWIGAYGRPVEQWQVALNSISSYLRGNLKFFALDIEPEADGIPHPLVQSHIDGVTAMGVRPIVYTTYVQWPAIMLPNEQVKYGTTPLWDYAGLYNGNGVGFPQSITEPPFNTSYANGWNTANIRSGWQLNAEAPATINGIGCDIDVFSSTFIDGK